MEDAFNLKRSVCIGCVCWPQSILSLKWWLLSSLVTWWNDDRLEIRRYWVEVVFQCLMPHCVRCMPPRDLDCCRFRCCYIIAVEGSVSLAACVCLQVEVGLYRFAPWGHKEYLWFLRQPGYTKNGLSKRMDISLKDMPRLNSPEHINLYQLELLLILDMIVKQVLVHFIKQKGQIFALVLLILYSSLFTALSSDALCHLTGDPGEEVQCLIMKISSMFDRMPTSVVVLIVFV